MKPLKLTITSFNMTITSETNNLVSRYESEQYQPIDYP